MMNKYIEIDRKYFLENKETSEIINSFLEFNRKEFNNFYQNLKLKVNDFEKLSNYIDITKNDFEQSFGSNVVFLYKVDSFCIEKRFTDNDFIEIHLVISKNYRVNREDYKRTKSFIENNIGNKKLRFIFILHSPIDKSDIKQLKLLIRIVAFANVVKMQTTQEFSCLRYSMDEFNILFTDRREKKEFTEKRNNVLNELWRSI